MPGANDTSRVITAAGRAVLSPMGVVQKGRSRTWLDDHGWWLGVIEFQPSSWGPGTYLNAGAMFLWRPIDHLAFEVGHRMGDFSPVTDDDFGTSVARKAAQAADRIQELRAQFSTYSGVVDHYARLHRDLALYEQAHVATAYGLLGDLTRLRSGLDRALALREHATSNGWNSSSWLLIAREAASDETDFRSWAASTLRSTRDSLKLSQLDPLALLDTNVSGDG